MIPNIHNQCAALGDEMRRLVNNDNDAARLLAEQIADIRPLKEELGREIGRELEALEFEVGQLRDKKLRLEEQISAAREALEPYADDES
jgi:predicted  nucleic acid-binding Zn-ribbon protein